MTSQTLRYSQDQISSRVAQSSQLEIASSDSSSSEERRGDGMRLTLALLTLLSSASPVSIGLQDICGNKLVGSCPQKISLKVVGGDSSCAEKVPWNVLVELVTGPKLKAEGNRTTLLPNIFLSSFNFENMDHKSSRRLLLQNQSDQHLTERVS